MADATDMEVALFYMYYIHYPCVEPITGKNIRDFYIRLVKERILPTLTNPFAVSLLEAEIANYKMAK